MLFDGLENTDSTNIVSSGQIDGSTVDIFDDGLDFTGGKVDLYKIIALSLKLILVFIMDFLNKH